MLPTALAIAWPVWRRHRWGLLATVAYLACAAAVTSAVTSFFGEDAYSAVAAILGSLSLSLIGPAVYLVSVFSYSFDADVSARESCFPAGSLRLPVRTGALIGWPMAYAAITGVLVWLV